MLIIILLYYSLLVLQQYSHGSRSDVQQLPPGYTVGSMTDPCPRPVAPHCQEWIQDTQAHVSWIQVTIMG